MSQPKLEEWEEIQTRTFTRWVNAQLKKKGFQVEDVFTGFRDGIKLINLYEAISDEYLGKYNKNPKLQIQKIENLNIVLFQINKFVGSVGIKLQFSAEQVFAGEKNQILGMIWVLIHKFEIQDITEEQLSAREGLLLWCQKKTKGYKGVNVNNFTSSWQDGLAFCALIHKHYPNLIDFDSLDKADAKDNLQLAFDVAEKNFGIPQLLDAKDMVEYKPDDKSVMTYVAYYWKAFAASNKEKKAANQISRAAKNAKHNKDLIHDYEERAKKLKEWIAGADDKLTNTTDFGNNLEEVMKKSTEFNDYKKNQKPGQQSEKSDLAVMLANLQGKQRNEMVAIYEPPSEITTKAIQDVWDQLEKKQQVYDEALRAAIKRMKYLEMCLARFRARSKKVLNWQTEKQEFVTKPVDETELLPKLKANLKMVEALEDEKKSVETTMKNTCELGKEIVDSGHSCSEEVTDTMQKMNEGGEKISEDTVVKKQKLEEIINYKQQIEDLCVEYSTKSESLVLFLEDADLILTEPVKASSVKDVEDAQNILSKMIEVEELNEELIKELKELADKITAANVDPYQYSRYNQEKLEGRFEETKNGLLERQKELEEEHKIQEKNEQILQEYATICQEFKDFATEQYEVVTKERSGELEEQLKTLQSEGKVALEKVKEKLDKIKEVNNQLDELNIAEHAEITVQELEAQQHSIKLAFEKRVEQLKQDIYSKKLGSVSEEQLKDFMDTFKHFDKGNKSKLNMTEFKAACASVGEDIPDEELESTFKKYDTDGDGLIQFEEFISFMSEHAKEGTSYEEIIESFRALSGGADFVTEAQLRANMEGEEVDFLLTEMPPKGDGYDYVAYAKNQFGK